MKAPVQFRTPDRFGIPLPILTWEIQLGIFPPVSIKESGRVPIQGGLAVHAQISGPRFFCLGSPCSPMAPSSAKQPQPTAQEKHEQGRGYGEGQEAYGGGDFQVGHWFLHQGHPTRPKKRESILQPRPGLRKEGNYDKAIADFTKAIQLNAKDAEAYFNRGAGLWDERQLRQGDC